MPWLVATKTETITKDRMFAANDESEREVRSDGVAGQPG